MQNKILKTIMLSIGFFAMLSNASAQDTAYSLQECVRIALENNLSVQRSKLDLQASEVNFKQSKMARYPNLSLSTNYGSNWGRSIDPTSNTFIAQKISSSGLGGNSSLTLFNGFQIANAIKQNKIDYNAANFDLEKAKNDVSLSVVTLYLNVIFNKELLGNSNFQLNSTTEQLERTKKLVDAGSLPITNLLDLQAQQATNEVNLITAENNYNFALLQLKQALLVPAADRFEIEIPNIEINSNNNEIMTAEQVYKTAVSNQPEIKSAQSRIESAEVAYQVSKGAYLPSLSLNGSFRTNYSSFADRERAILEDGFTSTTQESKSLFYNNGTANVPVLQTKFTANTIDPDYTMGEQFNDNLSQFLGLNLSIPIFNNWRTKANVQLSAINKQRAELNALDTKNQLRQTIENATNDLLAASKSFTASEKQVKALQESYRIVENQYNLGAVNYVDFQVSANNLFIAKSDLVRAKYDYIFKRKVLDFYLGKPLSF